MISDINNSAILIRTAKCYIANIDILAIMADDTAATTRIENHFLRLFCAVVVILVTFVHYCPDFTVLGYSVVEFVYGIGRFSMPVFFMISGFFLFSKDGHAEAGIKRKILHLVFLIIIMKLAYFIVDLFRLGAGYIDVNQLIEYTLIASNYTVHEWFVFALLIMYIVWWGCMKFKFNTRYIFYLGIVLLAIDIIAGEILPMFKITSLGNFMSTIELGEIMYPFIAVFCFSAGYYIHKYMDVIDERYKTRPMCYLLIFGIVLNFIEVVYIMSIGVYEGPVAGHPGPNMYVGSVIMMITVFILSFRMREDQFRCRILEFMGRRMLPWMYAFCFIGTCLIKEFQWVDLSDFFMKNVVGLILAILIDLILAYLVYLLLKYLAKHFADKKKSSC